MSRHHPTLLSLCISVLVAASGPAVAADTDTADIPEGILAKMARMSAKMSIDQGGGTSADEGVRTRTGGSNAACGSLNVGNVDLGKRRIGTPLREVTVVIKGDVINANNKCR